MIKWDLFQGHKDGLLFANQSKGYTTLTKGMMKLHDNHNRHRKSKLTKFNVHS